MFPLSMNRRIAISSGILLGVGMVLAAGESRAASRFEFKEPGRHAYRIVEEGPRLLSAPASNAWVRVVRDDGANTPFKIGSRVVLRLGPDANLQSVLAGSALKLVKTAAPGLFVLQASDAWQAAAEAQRLSTRPAVISCHPEMKRPIKLNRVYSPQPNDPYFNQQWHLEDRASDGTRLGPDVNARAAWPDATGLGVPIAIVDEGVEFTHPDLIDAVLGMPHYNFYTFNTNAGPVSPASPHGTAVAGLAGARGNNGIGVSGVAPNANLVSWVIFDIGDVAGEGQLADMFQYQSNSVPVQNHSWSYSYFQQLTFGELEDVAISNAVFLGRDGKGVVMVRSAGNDRASLVNANDDGYTKDPRIVTVAAVRKDGKVASYSDPGACILVAAPSGDAAEGYPEVYTTDLLGSAGINQGPAGDDASNYALFSGTSASSPMVAGIVALMLEVNPNLTYRDVQHILINASHQTNPGDPLMKTNQAGYRVNPNTGFGVPDAGRAVRLARTWPLRPPATNLVFAIAETNQIPNEGLRVETFGTDVPLQLASIIATPSLGLHPENLTPFMPVADVGWATSPIPEDLTGQAALIRRGTNTFLDKINTAAAAGARLAIIANYDGDNTYLLMSNTYEARIPAVFIKGDDGVALREYIATNGTAQVRTILFAASYTNQVTTPLLVEHVGVRIMTDHSFRGDLRITVTSPAGTRSLLQNLNNDFSSGPVDWTYWTTHHFYESSQGVWTIQISDEDRSTFGNCLYAALILQGVPIKDQDHDGLDDDWEMAHFGNLAERPDEDPDNDGESNMAEYLQGTDPLSPPTPFPATITQWSPDYVRIAWPADTLHNYQLLGSTNVTLPLTVFTNLPGSFDTGEWFTPVTNIGSRFFMIRSAFP
jgi:subtilisin family serine protease